MVYARSPYIARESRPLLVLLRDDTGVIIVPRIPGTL